MSGLDEYIKRIKSELLPNTARNGYHKSYYREHKQERDEYNREYRRKHRDELLAKSRAKRQEMRAGFLPHSYYKTSATLTKEQIRRHEYYLKHRERALAYAKERNKRLRDERNDNQR